MTHRLLKTAAAAEYLGHKPGTLRQWRSRGVGPRYHKLVGGVVYDVRALDEFLKRTEHITVRAGREDALVQTR